MKKTLSLLLVLVMVLSLCSVTAFAAENYTGKTVILYTANVRGDVDVYAKVAAAKTAYENAGADVILADAGNFLQGTAAANSDRGLGVYNLMDAAGYDVAAMGLAEFGYADATTGYGYHKNVTKYYTQAELQNGAKALTYNKDMKGKVTADRAEKAAATFTALSANAVSDTEYYSFEASTVLTTKSGLKVGFYGLTATSAAANVQDGCLRVSEPKPVRLNADVTICLSNAGVSGSEYGDLVIDAGNAETVGAYVIDNSSKTVTSLTPDLSGSDAEIAKSAAALKAAAGKTVGRSDVILTGADSANWNGETNLGDLTTDALRWYAQNYIDGYNKKLPLVAIQNGGNCDNFLYSGEITETDLLKALPFSPMGIGVIELTGAQLLETLEAASQRENCPGFAQVSGLTYSLDTGKEYDAGEAYGKFFRADSVSRVTITSVNGKAFDSKATYAVVCDNFLINGNDTYYTLKEAKEAGAAYANNGNGVKVRDAVAQYIQKQLNGVIGSSYASAQGRISLEKTDEVFHDVKAAAYYADAVKWGRENSIVNGTGKETFGPDANMTRAALWAVLGRAAGADVDGGSPWYQKALEWAKTEGISDGTNPNGSITRQELVTMLYRNAGKPAVSGDLAKFSDASAVASWASDAMIWAVSEGLVKGSGSNLNPTATATRAQVVTILYRLMAK